MHSKSSYIGLKINPGLLPIVSKNKEHTRTKNKLDSEE
jgi:hypothetical protein